MVEISFTRDITTAWTAAGAYLLVDPVAHNLPLTLLTAHREAAEAVPGDRGGLVGGSPVPGDELRFWWGSAGGVVTGICFLIGPHACVVVAGDRTTALHLARAVAATVPHLPGVNGEIAGATAFAGEWASARHLAVRPGLMQTYYVLDALIPPNRPERSAPAGTTPGSATAPVGELRLGRLDELDLLLDWSIGFQRDVFGRRPVDVAHLTLAVRGMIERNELWVWHVGGPVAMTAASPTIGGITRIRNVYTPPPLRGAGHAAACVAGVVADRLAAGATHCVLYADLANPTSNGVYRRLGFQPHSQHVDYVFD